MKMIINYLEHNQNASYIRECLNFLFKKHDDYLTNSDNLEEKESFYFELYEYIKSIINAFFDRKNDFFKNKKVCLEI